MDKIGQLLDRGFWGGIVREIQNLYTRSGTKMILVSALMESIYTMIQWSANGHLIQLPMIRMRPFHRRGRGNDEKI